VGAAIRLSAGPLLLCFFVVQKFAARSVRAASGQPAHSRTPNCPPSHFASVFFQWAKCIKSDNFSCYKENNVILKAATFNHNDL